MRHTQIYKGVERGKWGRKDPLTHSLSGIWGESHTSKGIGLGVIIDGFESTANEGIDLEVFVAKEDSLFSSLGMLALNMVRLLNRSLEWMATICGRSLFMVNLIILCFIIVVELSSLITFSTLVHHVSLGDISCRLLLVGRRIHEEGWRICLIGSG